MLGAMIEEALGAYDIVSQAIFSVLKAFVETNPARIYINSRYKNAEISNNSYFIAILLSSCVNDWVTSFFNHWVLVVGSLLFPPQVLWP